MVINNKFFSLIPILLLCFELIECHVDVLDAPNGALHKDYVDPHSFYYDRHTKQEVKSLPLESSYRKIDISSEQKCNKIFNDCLNGLSRDVSDDLFSRRLINMLLSLADFEENDRFFTSNIMIELTKPELKKLQNFGLGKGTIREIDSIVKHVFRTPTRSVFMDIAGILYDWSSIIDIFPWRNKQIIIASLALGCIVWLLLKPRWTHFNIIFTGIIIIFVSSFFITYLHLLEKAEIKLTAKQFQYTELPTHCRTHEMTWLQTITYIFSPTVSNDCEKYHEAMMENPFLEVTPAQALSHMLAKFSLQPMSIVGSAIGDFVKSCTEHMPILMQYVLQPMLIVVVIIMLLIFIACLCGCSPSIGLGPLRLFSLRGRNSSQDSRPDSRSMIGKEKREPIEIIQKLRLPSHTPIQQLAVRALENGNSSTIPSISDQPIDQSIEVIDDEFSEGTVLKKSDLSVGGTNSSSLLSSEAESHEFDGYEIITTIRNSRNGDN